MTMEFLQPVLGIAGVLGGVALIALALKKAPLGYEDDAGFHLGEPAPAAVNDNTPQLSRVQQLVLGEMREEISYPAPYIATMTGLTPAAVTRARADLRDLGLVGYGYLNSDGGEGPALAGRGYWLTAEGAKVRDALVARELAA